MFRKLSETFTATHFTILAGIAMIVPGALYGAVATQAVSITDPNTGAKSAVDPGRRLWVYDTIAAYRTNPQFSVRIHATCTANGTVSYAPPPQQSFMITAIDLGYYGDIAGQLNYVVVSNYTVDRSIAVLYSSDSASSRTADLGSGYLLRNGEKLACYGYGDGGGGNSHYATIVGYLVPSALNPPASAMGQSVTIGPETKGRK